MTQSKTIFAAAVVFGAAVTLGALVVAPFNASASAAAGNSRVETVSGRIGAAFATAHSERADPTVRAVAVRVSKGDLYGAPGCASATWPNIATDCLASADGSPVKGARFVTLGYQTGEAETVLLRIPAAKIASR